MRTSLVRNPFVSPELCPSMPWRPHVRFMQQRLAHFLEKIRQLLWNLSLIGGWPRDRCA
ncbi:MAG: hypothetical protein VB140_06665 [Burkholderia sp.]